MSIGAGQVTRFGIAGQIWRPAGSFAGKVGDTTAPVLSLPTGTSTGSTTATGTVSTDEANGALYFWATTNATETAADIVSNGSSQSVSATGVQNVSFSGLTASTDYYAHFTQEDDALNRSNAVNSALFKTSTGITLGGGRKKRRKPLKIPHYARIIKFESDTKSFEVEELPIEFKENSFGLTKEISRFEGAAQTLRNQLDVVQSEIDLFKAREDLDSQIRAELLIKDTILAESFIDGLLLQILELRTIKRKREEEEIIVAILLVH